MSLTNDIDTSDDGAETQEDDLYFLSTQMQSRHEETLTRDSHERELKKSISRLSSFKHDDKSSRTSSPAPIEIRQVPSKRSTTKRKLGTGKRSKSKGKPKSSSESVREKFERDKYGYFAGEQTRIDDYLQQKLGELKNSEKMNGTLDSSTLSKDEWNSIIENYDKLSHKNKKTLKSINKIMNEMNDQGDGIWGKASSNPETKLTEEELRTLYDLSELITGSSFIDDDDDNNSDDNSDSPAVFILTQSPTSKEKDKPETVYLLSDIDTDTETCPHLYNHADSITQEHEKEIFSTPSFDPSKEKVESIIVLAENMVSTQRDEVLEIISNSESEPEEIPRPQVFQSINSPKHKKSTSDVNANDETIESDTTPIVTPHKTPTKKIQVPSSEKPSPLKFQLTTTEEVNTENDDDAVIFTDNESIYSTARSKFTTPVVSQSPPLEMTSQKNYKSDQTSDSETEWPVSSMPEKKPVPSKRLRTRVLEIHGALRIQNYDDEKNNIKLRKLGEETKIPVVIDLDNEIPNSQSSEEEEKNNSVSIIEITKEVKDNDSFWEDESTDMFNLAPKKHTNEPHLQVPSSPEIEIGGIENDILDSSVLDEDEPADFLKLTAAELRLRFKEWGLKPVQGKEKMVDILQGISKFVSPENLLSLRDQQLQKSVFKNLDKLIRENQFPVRYSHHNASDSFGNFASSSSNITFNKLSSSSHVVSRIANPFIDSNPSLVRAEPIKIINEHCLPKPCYDSVPPTPTKNHSSFQVMQSSPPPVYKYNHSVVHTFEIKQDFLDSDYCNQDEIMKSSEVHQNIFGISPNCSFSSSTNRSKHFVGYSLFARPKTNMNDEDVSYLETKSKMKVSERTHFLEFKRPVSQRENTTKSETPDDNGLVVLKIPPGVLQQYEEYPGDKSSDSFSSAPTPSPKSSPCRKKRRLSKRGNKTRKRKYFNSSDDSAMDIKRKTGGRSKTGCWTCRIRHKACPEEKPECSQCVRLQLTCDYSEERPDYMLDSNLQEMKKKEIRAITNISKKMSLSKKKRRSTKASTQ
ncbi:Structure-specific endonuclease subunit SLX4 [Candida maltosa Xu316]|uniref:Structure-specific endonuclease subunit SLX4 n=1 Tax=Candida maltosa (strain Xu316) TaxID=1245528 RepID=M3K124_CANMX|nr:Structure-specific endonuclease subunit SLX4 [Candida maltosa Xu316]